MKSTKLKQAGYDNYSPDVEIAPREASDIIVRRENSFKKQIKELNEDSLLLKATHGHDYVPQADDNVIPNSTMGDCCAEVSTTFADSGKTVTSSYAHNVIYDDITVKDMSIVDFMAKPLLISTTTWTTSNPSNYVLFTSSILNQILSNSYWSNKIQGFLMFRGTLVLNVKLNANPFQQGKLLLSFLPCSSSHAADPTYTAMHNANLTTKTQQPCVEIDCRDSSAIFKIPYVSPSNFCRAKLSIADTFDWGTVTASVLSPLFTGSGGETTVDVTTFMSFEDFELAAPVVPQSGKTSRKKFSVKTYNKEEQAVNEGKPISTALSLTSKAAYSLSGVPLISDVATTAGWVFNLASGVASAFGWSKPVLNDSPGTMVKMYSKYAATSDGVDVSYPLALISNNAISVSNENSIRDEDEMSFSYLKKVNALVDTFSWGDSSVSNTSVYTKSVSPFTMRTTGSSSYVGHTATWATGPPIFYLAQGFMYWRGGIKLTFKIVKTEFHTGRLQVTWTPNGYGAYTAPDVTTGMMSIREIIDISQGDTFQLTLPWMVPTNYLPNTTYSGMLDVRVLNELRHPETAASTVQVLVYACGADDFELAAPGNLNTATNIPTCVPFVPQMNESVIVSETIAGASTDSMKDIYATRSMGEMFTSVKQLLNRQSPFYITTYPTSTNGWYIWPWFVGTASISNVNGSITSGLVGGDTYSYIAPMYAFYRGSIRIQTSSPNADTTGAGRNAPVYASVNPGPISLNPGIYGVIGNATYNVPATTSASYTNSNVCTAFTGVTITEPSNGSNMFRIPYYSPTKCSNVFTQYSSTINVPVDISQPTSMLVLSGTNTTPSTSGVFMSRSAADDFQFSYFIGCPPVFTGYT